MLFWIVHLFPGHDAYPGDTISYSGYQKHYDGKDSLGDEVTSVVCDGICQRGHPFRRIHSEKDDAGEHCKDESSYDTGDITNYESIFAL